MRIWLKSILFNIIKISGIFYKSPSNFNYWYNFGFIALFFLISQIISGLILAMFYQPSVLLAFESVLFINNDLYFGWWVRFIHSNGASFFFLCVYIHMFRGLYYGSFVYPRQYLWITGAIIWILMIATAFFGYMLPWGQMSFWGAMVITSLIATIPLIGNDLLILLWGGFTIDTITLNRFYALHFALPFVILMVSIIHILFLHEYGSNNPLGFSHEPDAIPFIPYYGIKDLFSIILFLFLFFFIIYFYPDVLGHTDNYIKANSLITPAHIVPEWYFLPLYAVLRSVPNKLLGLILIVFFILSVVFIPFILKNTFIRSPFFRPLYPCLYWIFVSSSLFLGWIGSLPVVSPFLELGQFITFSYFFGLIVGFSFAARLDIKFYNLFVFIRKISKKW